MTALRRRFLVAVPLVAALTIGACASNDDAPGDTASGGEGAASEESSLLVYSGRDLELVEPLIEEFGAESGIDVQLRDGNSTQLAAQLLEEGENTPAQVFLSQDAGALGVLSEAGLLATLPEAVTDTVPAAYTSTDRSWVGLTGRARVIVYDSETVSADEVPGDVFDVLDERWRGQVAIAPTNASFQAFVTALRVAEGEDRAREWLEGLIANDAQIYERNGGILEAVNSGTVQLGLINHYYWARAEGDPAAQRAQIAFGDAGSVSALVNVTGVAILAGAEDSAAAHEFVQFMVSEQAQTYFLEETAEYPLALEESTPAGVPPLSELGGPDIDLSELASLEATIALLTEVGLL